MLWVLIVGLYVLLVAVSNLDIIHQSTEWGEEIAKESAVAIPRAGGWADYLFRVLFIISVPMIAIPILLWTGVI